MFPCRTTKEISELRNILKQLQPGTLGRSACMVLSAAHRAPPARVADPKTSHAEPGPSHQDSAGEAPWPTFGSLLPSTLLPPWMHHCYTRMAHKQDFKWRKRWWSVSCSQKKNQVLYIIERALAQEPKVLISLGFKSFLFKVKELNQIVFRPLAVLMFCEWTKEDN